MDWDEQERGRRRKPPEGGTQRQGQTGQGRPPREDRSRARQPDAGRRKLRETASRPKKREEPKQETKRTRPPDRTPRQDQKPPRKPEQRVRNPSGDREMAEKAREARRRQAGQKKREEERKRREETRRTPPKALPRRKLLWKLLTTAAVVVALLVGLTIFFKVQNVVVTGNGKYTAETVIAASGIETGENLLTFGKSRAAGRILAELPYVDQVQIGIKLPNTVNIDIVELEVSYAIRSTEGGWWLMDCGGKLLEPV